jgi:RimJ/RimL family protein N-acetyltransferase
LAGRLYRGEPIEGWTGSRGFLVGDDVFGTFFTGPPGSARLSFGLAGMLPAARRTQLALAAAVAVERRLREMGASSLQFEIDQRNRRSLALARRRGATPEYRALVCPIDPD